MINVVHAFTGVDAQYMAEKKVWGKDNINVVGSMEIDVDAIISCALIHENEKFHKHMEKEWNNEDYDNAREWLRKRNIGFDFKANKSKLNRIKKDKLKQLYVASVCIKNYGDISLANKVKLKDEIDLFTYSSPCQSFSIVGKQEGLNGTSGLLLECENFIKLNKPKVLLLENVKNLVGKKFINDFENWIKILDELGYKSYWQILNAKDYGIPQNRERVFCISIRKDLNLDFNFPNKIPLHFCVEDILEYSVEIPKHILNSFYNKKSAFRNNFKTLSKDYGMCITTKPNYSVITNNFYTKDFKHYTIDEIINNNIVCYAMSPKEYWKLMGFSDEDFDKVKDYISDTQLYKQAGNSIVVNCLEAIFNNLKGIIG